MGLVCRMETKEEEYFKYITIPAMHLTQHLSKLERIIMDPWLISQLYKSKIPSFQTTIIIKTCVWQIRNNLQMSIGFGIMFYIDFEA